MYKVQGISVRRRVISCAAALHMVPFIARQYWAHNKRVQIARGMSALASTMDWRGDDTRMVMAR